MVGRFAVRSVLDVGSGRGHAASWFHREGCAVVAMDGEQLNVKTALFPTVQHDMTVSPFICPVDMVHCQEVVEHIDPAHLGNLMATLANGSVVLMTHAGPGQIGHHHVNCQPSEYWVKQFAKWQFGLLPDDTEKVREIAKLDKAHHLARSGLVFAKKAAIMVTGDAV